jgi:hypothetical protein
MSRSRRHSPFIGMTTAQSEKDDKRLARRRLRQRDKRTEGPVDKREVSEVWTFDKDGRQQIDPKSKWMRK